MGAGQLPRDSALQSRTRRQCPHSTGLSSREERAEVALSVDIRRMRGGRDAQEVKGDALAFTLGTEEQEKPATSRHAGGETGPEPARRCGGRRRPRARLQDVSAGLPRGPRTVPLHTRGRVVGAQSSASETPPGAVPLPGRCPGCPEGRSRPALTSTALSLGGCSLGRPRPFPPFMTGPQTRPVSWSVAPVCPSRPCGHRLSCVTAPPAPL